MKVTSGDVRRWLYRYMQSHVGWFASPEWKVAGGERMPRLTADLERLAEHVASVPDDDERFVKLAAALEDKGWPPQDLEWRGLIRSQVGNLRVGVDYDRWLTEYLEAEARIVKRPIDS